MKNGNEFGRFIINLTVAFFINFMFMDSLALKLYHAGYLRSTWNISFVGYIISLVVVYIVSYILFRPKRISK